MTRATPSRAARGAAVLRRFSHRDHVWFSSCSTTLDEWSRCDEDDETVRTYSSFSHAAWENGVSRIYIGFHFREAVEVGIAHGGKIGDRVVDRAMRRTRR